MAVFLTDGRLIDTNNMESMLPHISSLILVSVINNPRDLEIARVLGWYRIPLRSAPKVISVDFLAFYQTAAFGEDKWSIRYYAPVRGHELTTRAELIRDEADHPSANLEYYKIQLGPLQRLDPPINAVSWRRITFFYTTGELLRNAKSISDLIVKSEERKSLWQALHERATQSQAYQIEKLPDLDLDPKMIEGLLGLHEMENLSIINRKNPQL